MVVEVLGGCADDGGGRTHWRAEAGAREAGSLPSVKLHYVAAISGVPAERPPGSVQFAANIIGEASGARGGGGGGGLDCLWVWEGLRLLVWGEGCGRVLHCWCGGGRVLDCWCGGGFWVWEGLRLLLWRGKGLGL